MIENATPTVNTNADIEWLRQLGYGLRYSRSSTRKWQLCLLDGPNMSNLGVGGRDPRNFGTISSLGALHASMTAFVEGIGASLETYQSNHEGAIVGRIYEVAADTDAFIFNPAGLSKYGVPCVQALVDSGRPYVEVHFANTAALGWTGGTAPIRHAAASVMGLRNHGYVAALYGLINALDDGIFNETVS